MAVSHYARSTRYRAEACRSHRLDLSADGSRLPHLGAGTACYADVNAGRFIREHIPRPDPPDAEEVEPEPDEQCALPSTESHDWALSFADGVLSWTGPDGFTGEYWVGDKDDVSRHRKRVEHPNGGHQSEASRQPCSRPCERR